MPRTSAPPQTVHVEWRDVPAESDRIFHVFFNTNPKAALLACDRLGVTSAELLYRSRRSWDKAVEAASHVRPVAKEVDLAALAHLRYNMQERHRQSLFRELYAVRQRIVEEGSTERLWKEREELLTISNELREQLEDPPVTVDPLSGPELLHDRDSVSTPPPAAGILPVAEVQQPKRTGSRSTTRRSSAVAAPKPPAFPNCPGSPPICRFRSFGVLDRDEQYLDSARAELLNYAEREAAAERAFTRQQLMEPVPLLPAPPVSSKPLSARVTVRPLSRVALGLAEPVKAVSAFVSFPSLVELADGGMKPRRTTRTAEKELAALVRTTMSRVSQEAIAEQQAQLMMAEQGGKDARDVAHDQALLRRKACSPTTYSATSGRSSARRRASIEGLPSEEIVRRRAQKIRTAERERAAAYEPLEQLRQSRVDQLRHEGRVKTILMAQTGQARRSVTQSNRERLQRAAEAQRLADFEAKQVRLAQAAALHERRLEVAREQRHQHEHLQDMRKQFSAALERMAVHSRWGVPDELKNIMALAAHEQLEKNPAA